MSREALELFRAGRVLQDTTNGRATRADHTILARPSLSSRIGTSSNSLSPSKKNCASCCDLRRERDTLRADLDSTRAELNAARQRIENASKANEYVEEMREKLRRGAKRILRMAAEETMAALRYQDASWNSRLQQELDELRLNSSLEKYEAMEKLNTEWKLRVGAREVEMDALAQRIASDSKVLAAITANLRTENEK